ncbi:hypothetical protein Zmor_005918 [Zophobas morio]|uniref:DDE-1 domain-containing protein n=1 Tax=Zophobas morio TaxID=2755281 RepID=A0AA38MMD5_9CUCU|nr:hypothetical protein Zmor_005918 [Zophobas morio]
MTDTLKQGVLSKYYSYVDTHTHNALILACQHGIIMLQQPGHTTHRLQPFDVSFFESMEIYFTQAVEKWLRVNPENTVSQYHMPPLLTEAYSRGASIATIVLFCCGGNADKQ